MDGQWGVRKKVQTKNSRVKIKMCVCVCFFWVHAVLTVIDILQRTSSTVLHTDP